MDILLVLIPLSLLLVVIGAWAFFWAVDAGQFDDLDSPGWDALHDQTALGELRSANPPRRTERG